MCGLSARTLRVVFQLDLCGALWVLSANIGNERGLSINVFDASKPRMYVKAALNKVKNDRQQKQSVFL